MTFNEFYQTLNILPFPGHPIINLFFTIIFFSILFEYRYTNNKILLKIINWGFIVMLSMYSIFIYVLMLYSHIQSSLYKLLFFHFVCYFLAIYSILIVISAFVLKYKK